MKLTERLFATMKEKKITQEKLAKELNITQSTVSTWKKRETMPPAEFIPKICEILDTTYDYIFTGQEKKDHLTGEEKMLVDEFRCLNDTGRKQSLEYIKAMKGIHPVEIPEEKII